jgi:CheY-like chemotaxis protein
VADGIPSSAGDSEPQGECFGRHRCMQQRVTKANASVPETTANRSDWRLRRALIASLLPYDSSDVKDAGRLALVVEDDQSIREVIRDVLQERGFRVIGAANGAEALDCLDTSRPDVMVLDLLMPVMHGWEFMESYRVRTGGEAIPIVVVSVNPARSPAWEFAASWPSHSTSPSCLTP